MTDYIDIRHRLHEHPQTAGNEEFAHDTILRHLQGLHPDKVYTHVGGYGVIAVWLAKKPHTGTPTPSRIPTIAFRADTDALPIGHRCGHDGHTTILLRLAELVDSAKLSTEHLTLNTKSNILLLFQPAEETGTGAQSVLESGILQQYDIVRFYALHNLPGYPLGTVVLTGHRGSTSVAERPCKYTFAAASTGIIYHLDGRETHASTPEMGINPGLAVAEIIKRFNAFNGTQPASLRESVGTQAASLRESAGTQATSLRESVGTQAASLQNPYDPHPATPRESVGTQAASLRNPYDPHPSTPQNEASVACRPPACDAKEIKGFRQSTLVCVHLGSPAFGTSAGHAEVMFTLRAFTNDEMELFLADANAAVDEIASRYGLTVSRMLQEPFHATENDGDCVEEVERAANEVPLRICYQMEPNRWSEDFAEYLLHYRGAMFGIGSGERHHELHHPDYDFPDGLVEPAAQLFLRLAIGQ